MNEKMEMVRNKLKTPAALTGGELLAAGVFCFLAGLIMGLIMGVTSRGSEPER